MIRPAHSQGHPTRHVRPSHAGFSLVELMVAMTIGLVIAGAVATVFVGARQSARYQESIGRLQESGRIGLDIMSYAVRNAGYRSCGSATTYASVINGGKWWADLDNPLLGYEGGVSTFPAHIPNNRVVGADALVVVGVDAANEATVKNHNPSSAQFDTTTHAIRPGAILLLTDCAHTAVFQMTNPANINNNATNLVHNTGESDPGNCYKQLGESCGAGATDYAFPDGSALMRLQAHTFYVAPSASGTGNALWSATVGETGIEAARELLEGVDDLQLEYGEDTDKDGAPDRYVSAGAVASWPDVISVRIHILVGTLSDGLSSGLQTFQHNGSAVQATDRRVRRSFSTVVALRNRSQ